MRRRAREAALQTLYLLESHDAAGPGLTVEQGLRLFFDQFLDQDAESPEAEGASAETLTAPEMRLFVERLVRGVRDHRSELDAVIGKASQNWRVERMARVDRNLLRLAAFEIRYCADIPPKVTINEAVEIAKRFGTRESGAFVNGILDRILTEAGR